MAKAIGPNFIAELKAAGVTLNGWTWGKDGTFYFGNVQQATRDQIQAIYEAHNPATPEADSEKDGRFDDFLDSTGGLFVKALILVFRAEINAVRQNPIAVLPAYSIADIRDKVKAAVRQLS